jgi:hypothetical protein
VKAESGNKGAAELAKTTHNSKKSSPVEVLESAVAARRRSQTELSDVGKLLADKSARQLALETTGDLHDAAVLAEIGRLQIFTGLLPRRIAVKQEEDVKAERSLIQATNQFIQEHLGPRVRRLAARTREMVEDELSSHFQDAAARIIAVSQSERVRSIERLAWAASVDPERGAIAHAEGAIKAWAELQAKAESENQANRNGEFTARGGCAAERAISPSRP